MTLYGKLHNIEAKETVAPAGGQAVSSAVTGHGLPCAGIGRASVERVFPVQSAKNRPGRTPPPDRLDLKSSRRVKNNV